MPGEVAYDDPVPVPLADLTTGDPISHATFGVSLDVLKSRILWSWPEHITPDDISFQAEGGLRLRDDANTAAMTIESMAETPPPHPHGNKRYLLRAISMSTYPHSSWAISRPLLLVFPPFFRRSLHLSPKIQETGTKTRKNGP